MEDATFVVEKADSKLANKSVYLSSVYNSEEEKIKQDDFERNLDDMSDDKYFNRMKDEKNLPYSRINTQRTDPECDYREMAELRLETQRKNGNKVYFFH